MLEAREAKYGWGWRQTAAERPKRRAYRLCEGIGHLAK